VQQSQPSIAVLPFANMSGDPEQEYFSDGISEDLITALSNISRLSVVSRNSVFAYKGQSLNAKRIGEELGVSHIVEGSVRKGGERVRITAQLIDAATDRHLWSERYDRTLEDVFAVQDDITQNIVTALNVALLDGDQAMNWRRSTQNPEAYYLFLRGRHAFQSAPNRKTLEEAERLWQRCVELDPGFARAYSGLSGLKTSRVHHFGKWDDRLLEEAEEYARKAVDLEENLAHGHSMLGFALWYKREFDEALAAHERALQLDPEGPQTLRTYALIQVYNGKWSEAEKFIRKSISSTPSPTPVQAFISGLIHLVRGRIEESIRVLNGVAAKGSDFLAVHLVLAVAYAAAERMADAEAQVGEVLRIDPSYVVAERAPHMFRFRESEPLDRIMVLLRKAGLPE
jgi:adenylate cyclase